MHSATQSSGKSTGNEKRIRPPLSDEFTEQFSLSRTDFFDYRISVLSEFDEEEWMSWK